MMKKEQLGLSLVELMVVMVILGLLSGLIVVKVIPALDIAKVRTTKLRITKISGAVERYMLDTGERPMTLSALVARPDIKFWMGPYLEEEDILDGWSKPFAYVIPGEVKEFDAMSLGKDGVPGGMDANADITN